MKALRQASPSTLASIWLEAPSYVPKYSVSIDTVGPSAEAVPLNINASRTPGIAARAKLFIDLAISFLDDTLGDLDNATMLETVHG